MDKETNSSRRRFLGNALKIGGAVALAGSGLTGLIGCSSGQQGAPAAKAALKVRMGIVPGTQPLWRLLGNRNAEWLGPLGYDVEFINFTDEATMRTAFVNKDIEVYTSTIPATPSLVEQTGPCQFFMPYAWIRQGLSFFVKKESSIQSMADLKGKRVSVFPMAHPGFAYWRAALVANYGFKIEDQFQLIHSNQPDLAVDTGDAEAAIVGGWAWVQRRETGRYRLVADLYSEWKKALGSDRLLILGGAVARTEWIKQNQQFVNDYLKVARQGMEFMHKDPKAFYAEAAGWSGGGTAPPLKPEQAEFLAQYDGLVDAGPERVHLTAADIEANRKVFTYLHQSGYLSRALSADEVSAMFYVPA